MADVLVPVLIDDAGAGSSGSTMYYAPATLDVNRALALNGSSSIQATNLVTAIDPRLFSAVGNIGTANDARATRVIIPRTGTLTDLAIYVGTSSGNVDVAVYSTTPTRSRLFSTGSIACPTGGTWTVVGNPNLAVTQGEHYDLAIACDNITATFGRTSTGASPLNTLPANFLPSPAGASPKLSWTVATSFPLPATVGEAAALNNATFFSIIARVV